MGSLALYQISRTSEGKLQAEKGWTSNTSFIQKVNSFALEDGWFTIGGINKSGKGAIEVFKTQNNAEPVAESH